MSPFAEISGCAARHLEHYIDPAGRRGIQRLRQTGRSGTIRTGRRVGACTAGRRRPRLARRRDVRRGAHPYTARGTPASASWTRPTPTRRRLLTSTSWMRAGHGALCAASLRHSDDTPGLAASMVTKMLHRKRPISSRSSTARLRSFTGRSRRTPWKSARACSGDFHTNQTAIEEPRTGCNTSPPPTSPLRYIDIIVWAHVITGCRGAVRRPARSGQRPFVVVDDQALLRSSLLMPISAAEVEFDGVVRC